MRISDWSSDVCSSDLCPNPARPLRSCCRKSPWSPYEFSFDVIQYLGRDPVRLNRPPGNSYCSPGKSTFSARGLCASKRSCGSRSEEHTSELQSLMRNSYAVFCLKTKNTTVQLV